MTLSIILQPSKVRFTPKPRSYLAEISKDILVDHLQYKGLTEIQVSQEVYDSLASEIGPKLKHPLTIYDVMVGPVNLRTDKFLFIDGVKIVVGA